MTRFSFLVLIFFVGGVSVAAQDKPEQLFVNVYTPNPQHGTVTHLSSGTLRRVNMSAAEAPETPPSGSHEDAFEVCVRATHLLAGEDV
jgi:hypothetical protein